MHPKMLTLRLTALVAVLLLNSCKLIDSSSSETSVGTPTSTPATFVVVPEGQPQTPPGEQPPPPPPEQDPEVIEEGLVLHDAEPRTKLSSIQADFITLNRYEMKVGFKADCSDGQWEPWQSSKIIQLTQLNQNSTISVQYKDWDLRISTCYSRSFVHDASGPDILFQRYPQASEVEGNSGSISVQVADSLSEVKTVVCSMNGITRPCFPGVNEVAISAMPIGDYKFEVTATDELGNSNTKSVSWTVVASTRLLTQSIKVDNYKKVDILFVIDNSGSMAYEQQNMAERTANFISVLNGLDWQIGVTTTDPRNISLGDGRLIPLTGATGQYLINSTMPELTARERLSKTLQRTETGSGSEQGVRAAYRLVERSVAGEAMPKSFFRDGGQFAVVLISDEDESDNTPKNDPQNLVSLVHNSFGGQKRFNYHSIITRPGDEACRATHGAAYGERYKIMSELTGGLIGNVCENDYAAQVQGVAEGIRNLLKTLTLECSPLVEKGIHIEKDGVFINPSFTVEGVNLRMSQELEPGDYRVTYRCVK